uniref:Uncharacterized protein n=1 Tax=Nicotiana tabacum TaxID=4097 RepID=A0A1S3XXP4_TOBAC|nr:PREDICTED: uncharacterized protein LOC107769982 [Nicotiana tabacum]
MQEDCIVVVDHDTPEMNPRERKPAGVMKSLFMNTFDSGGTIQVVENKSTKSKKPILTIKYPFQGNIDNPVDFRVLCKWNTFINRGLRTNEPDSVYTEASNKLNKIFKFGVDDIGGKNGSSHLHIPAYPCVIQIQNRYGILLWDYGVKKQREHADSDDESTGRLKDQIKKDNKKKSKSHSVVDDKSLKDNKKKGKTHVVCDNKTLKDIKKKSKIK